jgi:hypothetical protein
MLIGVLPNLFGMDIPAEHLPAIERYTRELTDHIEKAARAALANRKPSSLAWGIGKVGFAANRRLFPLKPIDHDLPILSEFGPRSGYRINKKNTDGWFRMDLRKDWIERAEVLFLKPKPVAKN